jgi:myosin heavy subunit
MESQLASGSVLDAVRLVHSGYAHRMDYREFAHQYVMIATNRAALPYPPPPGANPMELARQLLEQIVAHPSFRDIDLRSAARFGMTKVFMRRPLHRALQALLDVRKASMDRWAVALQALYRGYRVRRRMREMWEGLQQVQGAWRTLQMRRLWLKRQYGARVMQSLARSYINQCRYYRIQAAITKLQAWWRRQTRRLLWARLRRGVRVFHSLARGYVVRRHVAAMVSSVKKLQRYARGFLVRNRAYWTQVRGALLMQAAWRGYRWRLENEDVCQYLTVRRFDRARS